MRYVFLLVTISLIAATAFATPIEVLLFPSGAIVTETTVTTVSNSLAQVSLPITADPQTLKVSLIGAGTIASTQFDSVREVSDVTDLEQQLRKKKIERQTLQDALQGHEESLIFWKSQKDQELDSVDKIAQLGILLQTKIKEELAAISQCKRSVAEIDAIIQELERKVTAQKGTSKRYWSVLLTLKDASAQVTLNYSYKVHAASWSSRYLIDARPGEKKINWNWSANIQQSTGQDWENVDLTLATAEPTFTLSPPELANWVIQSRPPRPLAKREYQSFSKSAEMVMTDAVGAPQMENAAAPVRQQASLFDLYHLGQRTIRAGEGYTFDINHGSWPASFSYLVRPVMTPQAFLAAKINLNDPVPMPLGDASLLVDGVFLGKRSFSLHESEFGLAFGNDPGIKITVKPDRKSDIKGLINKDRTYLWNWLVKIENNKDHAVDIRFEDIFPLVQDGQIELTPETALMTRTDDIVSREISLTAGEKSQFQYGYSITYPVDLNVDLGR